MLKQRAAGLLALCGSLWLVLVVMLFIIHWYFPDHLVAWMIHEHPVPHVLERFAERFTMLGDREMIVIATAVLGFCALLVKEFRLEIGILLAEGFAAAILENLLKAVLEPHRVIGEFEHLYYSGYAFPSGHSMLSVCFYGMLFYLLAQRFPRWKALCYAAAVLFALMLGASRLILHCHYATDVIGGYLVALPMLAWGIYWFHRLRKSGEQAGDEVGVDFPGQ